MREREAATKKTKLSSFRFFFDHQKRRFVSLLTSASLLFSLGDKKEEKKKILLLFLSLFFVTHTHTHNIYFLHQPRAFTDTIFYLSLSLYTGNDSLDARLAIRSTCNRRTRWRA